MLLLRAKAALDLTDANGEAPLHLAAINGHADAVQALVDARADVHVLTAKEADRR